MGYCANFVDADFEIKKENFKPCLEAMIEKLPDHGWCGNIKKIDNLQKALEEWRWDTDLDVNGNIDYTYFNGDKLGDEEELWKAIAPYVESGSYIEMSGEEHSRWRWTFNNGKMENIEASICWDDEGEIVANLLNQKALLPTLLGVHPTLDGMIGGIIK